VGYEDGKVVAPNDNRYNVLKSGTRFAEQSVYRVPSQNVISNNEPLKYARHVKTYAKRDYVIT
jgi:hypothetical protein